MKKLLVVLGFLLPLFANAQKFTSAEIARYKLQSKAVTIIRDNYGVPHIYSQTDAGVVFGLMYTQCEDNFKGIERNYLYQLGRQSEADGEGPLYTDVQLQLIADTADAIKDYNGASTSFKKLLNAFADGINYYLYKHPEVKPMVFKRFKPWFPLMFTDGSVAATETGGISPKQTQDFYGGDTKIGATINPVSITHARRDRELGSNGFAISPSRSANGHAMLYINPHVPFYFRSEVGLHSNEGLNAYGAVTWGQFFIYQGFNAHCGWMHTSSYADVGDVYLEKVVKQNGKWYYEYDGKLRPLVVKSLTIKYQANGQTNEKRITAYFTHHGPVLGMKDGKWMALKHYNRSYKALLESWLITKANSLPEYKKAMDLLANTSNNTVYADDKGNTAFWYGNFVPRRDPAVNRAVPVDGSTSATEWKGLHPLSEIVQVHNPSTGYIQNCNSSPFSASGKASPDKAKYPRYMAPDDENYRAVNAIRLLKDANRLTLDGLIEKGYDRYLAMFDDLLPALFKAYDQSADSVKSRLAQPIATLRSWDRRSAVNSAATTLAIEYASNVMQVLPPALPGEYTYQLKRIDAFLQQTTPEKHLAQLTQAVNELEKRYGNWQINWGDINRYQRPADGTSFDDAKPSLAVGLTSSNFGQLPSFQSRLMPGTNKRYGFSGNSFVAAVEFGPRIKAKTIITGGTSFDPASKHYTDEADGYINGKFKDVLFYKEDVRKHAEKTYHP